MQILIDDNQTISFFQEIFNKQFPYLKSEFISRKDRSGLRIPLKAVQLTALKLEIFRKADQGVPLFITVEMTVSHVEQLFEQEYGLEVKIFRKSGRIWLETVLTEDWTLDFQNREGEILSRDSEL
jgi:hypothetical protein